MGAHIVLSPVGFVGNKNIWLQVSGVWQKAQLNHFFAVESGFNGELGKTQSRQEYKTQGGKKQVEGAFSGSMGLWGESIIHAPLPMTPKEDGILQRTYGKKGFIISDLDLKKRKQALKEFNALAQLNPEFYAKIRGLGGKMTGI